MAIIKERMFDFSEVTSRNMTLTENLMQLLEELCEAKDVNGDPFYDYYSIAHHVLEYLDYKGN